MYTLGFLRRNKKKCTRKRKVKNRKVKNLTYTSLVRSVVDYSSPIWNPSTKQQIQRKAARYVFNDYRERSPGAVTNMIDTLQ
jgi:hypothetical protein